MVKKSPLKCKFLRLSSARVKIVKFLMSILKRKVISSLNIASFFIFLQILHHSSVSWKMTPCTYLAQAIYTLLKRSPLKLNFLGLLSACVKICQIPHVNFETASQFLFKFCIILQCHERCLLFTFLSSRNMYFAYKMPIKVKMFRNFRVLWSKFVKFLMSSLKRQAISSLNITSFFIVMT